MIAGAVRKAITFGRLMVFCFSANKFFNHWHIPECFDGSQWQIIYLSLTTRVQVDQMLVGQKRAFPIAEDSRLLLILMWLKNLLPFSLNYSGVINGKGQKVSPSCQLSRKRLPLALSILYCSLTEIVKSRKRSRRPSEATTTKFKTQYFKISLKNSQFIQGESKNACT